MSSLERRLDLHSKFRSLCDYVYFQPPSDIKLIYPCIIYNKSGRDTLFANNEAYSQNTLYDVTIIYRDPDSQLPDLIMSNFEYCSILTEHIIDNLYHSVLRLYY